MKLSLNWIRKYAELPADLTMEQLSFDLTMRTVEVEGIEDLSERYENIVCGRILEVKPHPSADRLRVTIVDIGEKEPVQIVCGGVNLEVGQDVVVTLPGSHAVWHGEGEPVEIGVSELRGVTSYGMIAGANEIGLEGLFPIKVEHEIVDLKGYGATPGQPIADLLGLNDWVLEIDNKSLTNRPDLWGHYGMARELAAIYGVGLKELPKAHDHFIDPVDVRIENPERCRRFTALRYEGVDARKSTPELAVELIKVGIRPISAIVDITNYVMLAVGQPTHAYDRDHIAGGIVVRDAFEGERLTLLDGKELSLLPADLVIADHEKAVGLAGIMGGANDSILDTTQGILFEIANFEPAGTRKTTQRYGLRTESSIRYEKGLDSDRVELARGLVEKMIAETFPEARLVGFTDCVKSETGREVIDIEASWLSKRLGREVDAELVRRTLAPLGFETAGNGDALKVTAPAWRSTGDISLRDDILEEMARMIGYENFDFVAPEIALDGAVRQPAYDLDRSLREYLAFRAGYREIFTYPWMRREFVEASRLSTEGALELAQAPSPDEKLLRFSLVPGMLAAVAKNLRYCEEFRMFEVAQVFRKGAYSPSEEAEVLPEMGRRLTGASVGPDAEKLFFEVKGVLEMMGRVCGMKPLSFGQEEKPAWADRNAWVNVYSEGELCGSMGLVSPVVKADADLKFCEVCLFELNVEKFVPLVSRENEYEPLPQFPHVEQDLSVLLPESVTWKAIEEAVAPLAEKVAFVDEYRGPQIPADRKSVTLRVELGSDEGTLDNAAIDARMKKVSAALDALGAKVRDH